METNRQMEVQWCVIGIGLGLPALSESNRRKGTQVSVSQEYYKCRHRINCLCNFHLSIHRKFYLIWVFHDLMLWFLIFFSSLSLGNCWFWSHDRWQNSQATIKCDTHHPPLRYLQTQNMGCPLSNLFDMWTFCSRFVSRYLISWHFDAFYFY